MSFKIWVLLTLYIFTGGALFSGIFNRVTVPAIAAGIVAILMSFIFWRDAYDEALTYLADRVSERQQSQSTGNSEGNSNNPSSDKLPPKASPESQATSTVLEVNPSTETEQRVSGGKVDNACRERHPGLQLFQNEMKLLSEKPRFVGLRSQSHHRIYLLPLCMNGAHTPETVFVDHKKCSTKDCSTFDRRRIDFAIIDIQKVKNCFENDLDRRGNFTACLDMANVSRSERFDGVFVNWSKKSRWYLLAFDVDVEYSYATLFYPKGTETLPFIARFHDLTCTSQICLNDNIFDIGFTQHNESTLSIERLEATNVRKHKNKLTYRVEANVCVKSVELLNSKVRSFDRPPGYGLAGNAELVVTESFLDFDGNRTGSRTIFRIPNKFEGELCHSAKSSTIETFYRKNVDRIEITAVLNYYNSEIENDRDDRRTIFLRIND